MSALPPDRYRARRVAYRLFSFADVHVAACCFGHDFGAAAVQRWLSVAAGQLAFGPAAARLVTVFGAKFDAAEVIARAHALLKVIEAELTGRQWIAGDRPTIADVALYSYIARAPEGNVDLAAYPEVRSWLARIEGLEGFVPFRETAAGLSAKR